MEETKAPEQQLQEIQEFIRSAYEDPELRPHLRTLLDKFGISLPEPPYEKEVKRVKEQYDQEIGNLKKKLEEQEKARKEEQFIRVLESYGLSKDDFQDVLDFAKQNGIINFETAVRLYVSERLQKSRNSLPIRARQDDDVIKRYSGIDGKDRLVEDVLSMLGR